MNNRTLLKKCSAVIVLCIVMVNLICASSVNIPETLKIKVGNKDIGYEVEYDNFYITARKMYAYNYEGTIYCLDIDSDYPANNKFKLNGSVSENVENIIKAGYPGRSACQLELSNDDEAYYATQVAVWSEIEGYNVNKIKGDKKLVNAIKNIYNEGKSNIHSQNVIIKKYTPENKSIQRAVLIFKCSDDSSINENIPNISEVPQVSQIPEVPQTETKPSEGINIDLSEEEAEKLQPPFPPQEG